MATTFQIATGTIAYRLAVAYGEQITFDSEKRKEEIFSYARLLRSGKPNKLPVFYRNQRVGGNIWDFV